MSILLEKKKEKIINHEQYSQFSLSPLEKNTGITLGNSIRRTIINNKNYSFIKKVNFMVHLSEKKYEILTIEIWVEKDKSISTDYIVKESIQKLRNELDSIKFDSLL